MGLPCLNVVGETLFARLAMSSCVIASENPQAPTTHRKAPGSPVSFAAQIGQNHSLCDTWRCALTFEVSRTRRAQPGVRRLDRMVRHLAPLLVHKNEQRSNSRSD
jgi:hypothetical protein